MLPVMSITVLDCLVQYTLRRVPLLPKALFTKAFTSIPAE